MIRRAPLLSIFAFLASSAPAQEPTPPPVFGVELEVVRLDAVVLDDDGQPVTGLTADDFAIEEDGQPRDIVSFEPVVVRPRPTTTDDQPRISANRLRSPAEGRAIVVLFDDTHVTPVAAEFVREALVRFIRQDLRDGDWLTVLSPGQALRWAGRTAISSSPRDSTIWWAVMRRSPRCSTRSRATPPRSSCCMTTRRRAAGPPAAPSRGCS